MKEPPMQVTTMLAPAAADIPTVTEPAMAPEPVSFSFILYLLVGLLLSVLIVLANLLVVAAIIKFYRVQTASNCFLLTLSLADGLIGVLLPVTLLLQLGDAAAGAPLCLLPYCALAALSTVSILTTVAIAVDRFTSLAQPLRYNNLVTRRGVARYAAACWVYGLLVGLTPLALRQLRQPDAGAPGVCGVALVDRTVAGALAGIVFLPVAGVMVACYVYVYCVARTHAKAIHTVEVSLGRSGSVSARCGQTLALTVGAFLLCWGPLCLCLVSQSGWFYSSGAARGWLTLLALSSTALNPFLYSFHSAELRYSCHRLLESVLGRCGVVWWGSVRPGGAAFSTASNIRLCTMATNHTCIIREVCVKTAGSDAVSLYHETMVSTHLGVDNPVTPV